MLKIYRKLAFVVFQFVFLCFMVSVVNAYDTPVFPSCSNPQGTLKVKYDSGTFYIVGSLNGYVGSDAVYYTGGNELIQCFCAESGSGIQTNWWRVSGLSQAEIDQYVKMGWIYIPSGSNWGLDNSPYLAINANYSCKSNPNPPSNPNGPPGPPICDSKRPEIPQLVSVIRRGTEAIVTWTKVDLATHYTLSYGTKIGDYPYGVPNTGNVTTYTVGYLDPMTVYYFRVYAVNNCMPSEPSGTAPKGSAVLGLAATGDSSLLYTIFGSSFLLTTSGLIIRKKK